MSTKPTIFPLLSTRLPALRCSMFDGAVLKPAFSPNVKSYTATLLRKSSTTAITIEPTSSRSSVLTINGKSANSGHATVVPLSGKSTPVTIHVASPDGSQTADYVVTVVKP